MLYNWECCHHYVLIELGHGSSISHAALPFLWTRNVSVLHPWTPFIPSKYSKYDKFRPSEYSAYEPFARYEKSRQLERIRQEKGSSSFAATKEKSLRQIQWLGESHGKSKMKTRKKNDEGFGPDIMRKLRILENFRTDPVSQMRSLCMVERWRRG